MVRRSLVDVQRTYEELLIFHDTCNLKVWHLIVLWLKDQLGGLYSAGRVEVLHGPQVGGSAVTDDRKLKYTIVA
jgi:hypothetical protein